MWSISKRGVDLLYVYVSKKRTYDIPRPIFLEPALKITTKYSVWAVSENLVKIIEEKEEE